MKVAIIDFTPLPEDLIERIGRTCYNSKVTTKERRDSFISALIKNGHTSILEHAKITFSVEGVSRALTHQLVRHRMASYTQESQRYVSAENFDYVIPDSIKENPDAIAEYNSIIETIQKGYSKLISLGIPKEDARFLLPNSCSTKIYVTMNFRELRHFIELRSDSHAQWEIRRLSDFLLIELYHIAPIVFGDLYKKFIDK